MFLVTNKHVLPPPGTPRNVQIRVTVGTGDKAAVKLVDIPVVGPDGKYLPNVGLHPTTGFDVAALNVTEAIVKQGIQGAWLPLDLLSTPERLKNENINVGDEIFLLGYPSAIFDARNASPSSAPASLLLFQARVMHSTIRSRSSSVYQTALTGS